MIFSNEKTFEDALIKKLHTQYGWEKSILYSPSEDALINNWSNIIFQNNKCIDLLNNCPLTESEMNQIIVYVNQLKSSVSLNKFINTGLVSIKRDNKDDDLHFGKTVSLKIFDRSEIAGGVTRYQIVEQPLFSTNNNVYPNKRGDLMLLINGIPLIHIELKQTKNQLIEAEEQIKKYSELGVFTGLFSLIQIFVAMTPDSCVYYANPGFGSKFNPDYYFHWENENNDIVDDWDEFAGSVLSIPMAHQLIGYYTIPDESDGILKVMRSYQIYATQRIVDKVKNTHWNRADQYGGYIWHTTGSGKTMTSFKAAQLIALSKLADKVVFLLDRIELGDQTLINYRNFACDNIEVQETENTKELIDKLKSKNPSVTLIVTSIQKMSNIYKDNIRLFDLEKIKANKIVFIIDECHRDQNGEMHNKIKTTFPNAIYFGFTGTPDLEYTAKIFGSELHRYTITHGIRDHNVLGFDRYMVSTYSDNELRTSVGLQESKCKDIDEAYNDQYKKEIFRYYMNQTNEPCPMTKIESFLPKSQYDNDKHRKKVIQNILDNWKVRSDNSIFHSIFATSSILEAIAYYRLFKTFKHDLHVCALFDPNETNDENSIEKINGLTEILNDYKTTFGMEYNVANFDSYKKDLCARLAHKNPYFKLDVKDKVDIVIVVEQLLTGFDSKWISTLYLDKLLYGKNFIQAVSRTNRLFGPDKPHGIVVWYRKPYTMEENLLKAVNDYSGNCPTGIFVDDLKKNINGMNFMYTEIERIFDEKDIKNFSTICNEDVWMNKFASLFNSFVFYLRSAKMQGFDWNNLEYPFKENNKMEYAKLLFNLDTYNVLLQRYRDMFVPGPHPPFNFKSPFNIEPTIIEQAKGIIDDRYILSQVDLYKKALDCGDEQEKEKMLVEIHRSFASLSAEQQFYGEIFLHDVESGKIILDTSKTLIEYINIYIEKACNDRIHEISKRFGLNEIYFKSLVDLNLNVKNLNEFGRFDALMKDFDIDKALAYYQNDNQNIRKFEARVLAEKEIRSILLN